MGHEMSRWGGAVAGARGRGPAAEEGGPGALPEAGTW
jgi:hypothetical protein